MVAVAPVHVVPTLGLALHTLEFLARRDAVADLVGRGASDHEEVGTPLDTTEEVAEVADARNRVGHNIIIQASVVILAEGRPVGVAPPTLGGPLTLLTTKHHDLVDR